MDIVISALHFEWNSIAECKQRLTGEFNLDGVELSLANSWQHPHCRREELPAVAELATAGLAVSAHIWENPAALKIDEAEERLLDWLHVCGEANIKQLIIHGGSYPRQREGIRRVRRLFERILPAYERVGVILNLENHYAYSYHDANELFSEVWEFLEVFRLDSPSLRFCFDTGHGNMTKNGIALLTELAPWLNYVHLADNYGIDDNHVGFRQGTTDWDGYLQTLRDLEFDGTYCVEFPVREDQAPFRACLQELRAPKK